MKTETDTPQTDAAAFDKGCDGRDRHPNGPYVESDFARRLERKNTRLFNALSNLLDTSAVTEADEDFTSIQCVNKHYEEAYDAMKANGNTEAAKP